MKVNEDGRSSPPYRSLGSRLRERAPRPAPLPLMRGAGDTATPMLVVLGTVVLNVAIDPLLTSSPRL